MAGDPRDDILVADPSARWSDAPSRDALQLIADGVTQVAGFGVAAISAVREDGYLEVMAVAGSDEAREQLAGTRVPVERVMEELANADNWGLLRFVPYERLDPETVDHWGWVPDIEPVDGPDAWHPMDLLIAPLYDDEGALRGTLAIDLPVGGRRPGETQRAVLNTYAEQAGRAVVLALEREALAEQVRMAEAARQIVRRATAQLSPDRIATEIGDALLGGFRAAGVWMQAFDLDGHGHGTLQAPRGQEVTLPPHLVDIAVLVARRAWELQQVEIISTRRPVDLGITAQDSERVLQFLEEIGVGSLLLAPLGAGKECLGILALTRTPDAPEWSEAEATTALDIGHDIGGAILNARTFEREHQLVEELRELDTYKSQLIATVAHELKNPLTSVLGHLEMLEFEPDLSVPVKSSLAAMDRGARRMVRVVEDLLLLSKVGDPNTPLIPTPVDLRPIVDDAIDLTRVSADQKDLKVCVHCPEDPALALGVADELDVVCANLVSNAVKYTPGGRCVTIALERAGNEVILACTDEGIGISPEDLEHLGTEFFRSTNPEAVALPGTGLGLAIVKRIIDRHHGRLEVESELGRGTTFRVHLPAASA